MGLPIASLAANAYRLAKQLAPTVFQNCNVKMGRTPGTYNPTTDTTTGDTWAQTVNGVKLLKYNDANEREDQPIETKMCVFLASMADFTNTAGHFEQDAEITEVTGSLKWDAYRVELDPSNSVILFYCRR